MECEDLVALESFQTYLASDYLKELNGVLYIDEYLDRMSQTSSQPNEKNLYGVWGDIFCIKWFSNWLKVPIVVWSLMKQRTYIHFNTNTMGYCYNILFHDQIPAAGHFEPFLTYRNQRNNGHMTQGHVFKTLT